MPHNPCRANEKGDNEQGVNKWIGNSCVRWQLVRGPPPGTVLGDRHFGTLWDTLGHSKDSDDLFYTVFFLHCCSAGLPQN